MEKQSQVPIFSSSAHILHLPFALKERLKIFNHICGLAPKNGYKSLLTAVHISAKRLTVWSGAVRESHHESAAPVCLEGHKGTAYDKLFPTTQRRPTLLFQLRTEC